MLPVHSAKIRNDHQLARRLVIVGPLCGARIHLPRRLCIQSQRGCLRIFALFQQAAELSGHLRYLALSFRRGGERFAFHLQRELGVSARLLQEGELCPAQLVLLYENRPAWEKQGTVNLPLYGECSRPWPVEYVTDEEQHPLFFCFDREKLLSHMVEMGVLTEKKVKIRTKKQNT